MMKIVADENIPYVEEAFSSFGEVVTCNGRAMTAQEAVDADILLVRSVTHVNKALLKGSSVKFVASATAGLNHIDLKYLKKNDIAFSHAPGSNAVSAAEYVLSAICYWSLKVERPLNTLRLGIVGYGNVGKRVKEYASTLGMECIVTDPLLEEGSTGTHLDSLDAVLDCDVITLHTPLTKSGLYPTYQLIGVHQINNIRSGCLLINAARGGVIDEQSLLDRLLKKDDLSLVLDVWENEPLINIELLEKTLISTPHIAGYSLDGKLRGTEMILQACATFLNKQATWCPDDAIAPIKSNNIFKNWCDDRRPLILQAYDIQKDNDILKLTLEHQEHERGQYFDSLRKNYPIRREFMPSELCVQAC